MLRGFFADWQGAALVALACVTLVACSKAPNAQARPDSDAAKPVQVEPVREEPIQRAIDVVGTLAAEDEVTISAEAEGRVERLLADLGDGVQAGQVLIVLDHEKAEYNLDQQKAALARALAKYGATEPDTPPMEQTPEVQKAQAELVQAQQAFKRAKELDRRQLLPPQTLDDANATLRAKQAGLRLRPAERQEPARRHRRVEGGAAAGRAPAADTSIRAPFDGYIQKRLVSLGEFVRTRRR